MVLRKWSSPLSLLALLSSLSFATIVFDFYFNWAVSLASDLGIPAIHFQVLGFFPALVIGLLAQAKTQGNLSYGPDDLTTPFLVPGLPHQVYMLPSELPEMIRRSSPTEQDSGHWNDWRKAKASSFGSIVNSFRGIESAYADHFMKVRGTKCWLVGPLSLGGRAERSCQQHAVMEWLDSKPKGSVVYACFGSWAHFSGAQMWELALGLQRSGHPFLLVVKDEGTELPEELEEAGGMVVRGWAPQVAILGHEAAGGFVTHCGWNSVLEGISAGLPMVTWPLVFEQFINEKLVVDILGIGVKNSQGFRSTFEEEKVLVKAEEVAKAVGRIMGDGEEAEGLRTRAKEYQRKAREAVKVGGDSYNGLSCLIDEIRAWPSEITARNDEQ